jgi:hypothetical protein
MILGDKPLISEVVLSQQWLNVEVLRLQEDDGKLCEDVLVFLLASIAASGGGRRRVTAAARAKAAVRFGSKIRTIKGTIYRVFG